MSKGRLSRPLPTSSEPATGSGPIEGMCSRSKPRDIGPINQFTARRATGIVVPVFAMISGMTAQRTAGRPSRYGPRHAVNVRLPMPLYKQVRASAASEGLSVAEYVILRMAELEDITLPNPSAQDDEQELPLGA
jgi:hypothetical protein